MSDQAQLIYQKICKAVETDQLKLPTLPEVAVQVKQAVESDSHTAADIAELLSRDGALSARLLQLANSPLYRSRSEIDNLQMAITRLGLRIVKDLVVMLAIRQAFQASSDEVDKVFREIWHTSVDVAAMSRALANSHSNLDAEQAVLAGLIHNIGSLPVIEIAEKHPELFKDIELKQVIDEIQNSLGEKILSFWHFPQSLIDVASQCRKPHLKNSDMPGYVDIVQTALFLTGHMDNSDIKDYAETFKISGINTEATQLDEMAQQMYEDTLASLKQL